MLGTFYALFILFLTYFSRKDSGKDVTFRNVELDGALTIIIENVDSCSLDIHDCKISNKGWELIELDGGLDEGNTNNNDKVRGYKLQKNEEGCIIHLDNSFHGKWEFTKDMKLKRVYPGFQSKELEIGVMF